jgi:hypothetical protein
MRKATEIQKKTSKIRPGLPAGPSPNGLSRKSVAYLSPPLIKNLPFISENIVRINQGYFFWAS